MQRHNPGSSSLPGASIDLTPLLDVIFTFLFIVIISYVEISGRAQEEVQKGEEERKALMEQVEEQAEELGVYGERLEQYEVINDFARAVTIYCTYDKDNPAKRHIRVVAPDLDYGEQDIESGTDSRGFARLEKDLENYILGHEDSIFILRVNRENILARDYEKIEEILSRLSQGYEDVYIK